MVSKQPNIVFEQPNIVVEQPNIIVEQPNTIVEGSSTTENLCNIKLAKDSAAEVNADSNNLKNEVLAFTVHTSIIIHIDTITSDCILCIRIITI